MTQQAFTADNGFSTTGNITCANVTLSQGSYITESNAPVGDAKSIDLYPGDPIYPTQYLRIYPTNGGDADHLHLTSGDPTATEVFLGDDSQYVKLVKTGDIEINPNFGTTAIAQTQSAYYIKEFGDNTLDINLDYGSSMSYDTNGNLFVVGGSIQSAVGSNGIMNKYTLEGDLVSQKAVVDSNVSNPNVSCEGIWIDAQNNRFVMSSNETLNLNYVTKYNSADFAYWTTQIDSGSAQATYVSGGGFSGGPIVIMEIDDTAGITAAMSIYNVSGFVSGQTVVEVLNATQLIISALRDGPVAGGVVTFDGSISRNYLGGATAYEISLVVDDTTGINDYMTITGTGFSNGQQVTGVYNATQLTISAAATGTPSGTLTFTQVLEVFAITGDNNGNIYTVGRYRSFTSNVNIYTTVVIQFDATTGDVIWQEKIVDTGAILSVECYDIEADQDGVYIVGVNTDNDTIFAPFVAKLNINGEGADWQNTISEGVYAAALTLALNGSAAMYMVSSTYTNGGSLCVTKIDRSTGNIGWATIIQADVGQFGPSGFDITSDASGSIYVCGATQEPGADNVFIAKLDANGAVTWQRTLGNATDDTDLWQLTGHKEIAVYNQNYAITGYTYINPFSGTLVNADMFVAQFPTDGSFTGTYNDFVYQPFDYDVTTVAATTTPKSFYYYSGPIFAVSAATLTVSNNTQTESSVFSQGVDHTWTFGTTGALALPQGIELPGKVTNPGISISYTTPDGAPIIDISSGIVYLTPVSGENASYVLPAGLYDGQTVIFLPAITAGVTATDVNNVYVFSPEGFYNIDVVASMVPWYPFYNYGDTNSIGTPQAVWSATYNCWYPQPWNFD